MLVYYRCYGTSIAAMEVLLSLPQIDTVILGKTWIEPTQYSVRVSGAIIRPVNIPGLAIFCWEIFLPDQMTLITDLDHHSMTAVLTEKNGLKVNLAIWRNHLLCAWVGTKLSWHWVRCLQNRTHKELPGMLTNVFQAEMVSLTQSVRRNINRGYNDDTI